MPKKKIEGEKRVPAMHSAPFDFKRSITWRIFRIISEFTEGIEFISGVKHPVTVFGSARVSPRNEYYGAARTLARRLGRLGYTIITGGGGGILEAANRGAFEANAPSVGLNIQLPYKQRMNKYVKQGIGFYYFFTRKSMLSFSAQAYVFFPGGYGTLDELFTIMTLMQTKKIEIRPIVLYGSWFWKDLDTFIHENMLQEAELILPKDRKMYTIVDTIDDAVKLVQSSKEREYTFM